MKVVLGAQKRIIKRVIVHDGAAGGVSVAKPTAFCCDGAEAEREEVQNAASHGRGSQILYNDDSISE